MNLLALRRKGIFDIFCLCLWPLHYYLFLWRINVYTLWAIKKRATRNTGVIIETKWHFLLLTVYKYMGCDLHTVLVITVIVAKFKFTLLCIGNYSLISNWSALFTLHIYRLPCNQWAVVSLRIWPCIGSIKLRVSVVFKETTVTTQLLDAGLLWSSITITITRIELNGLVSARLNMVRRASSRRSLLDDLT